MKNKRPLPHCGDRGLKQNIHLHLEKRELGFLPMPSILAVGHVLADIVAQVAALAEVAKVGQVVVGFVVVHVCGGEHYPTSGDRVRRIVFCPAIWIRRRAFAAIARPLPDGGDDFGEPVGWVV